MNTTFENKTAVTAGNASLVVYPLCLLLVFLVLAALYESSACRWPSF